MLLLVALLNTMTVYGNSLNLGHSVYTMFLSYLFYPYLISLLYKYALQKNKDKCWIPVYRNFLYLFSSQGSVIAIIHNFKEDHIKQDTYETL